MQKYIGNFKDKVFGKAIVGAFILLGLSLVINFYAGTYANTKVSNPVTDIVLDNIPVFDVDGIFVYGIFAVVAYIALVCFIYPRRMPFAIKTIALFVVTRAVFISLTHLAPFPTHAVIDPVAFANYFMFGGDLFFSGHTGLPFLIALIFWDKKFYRLTFIFLSLFFGTVALLGHLHYSIDVFAAFFITYAVYHIALQIFKKDRALDS